MERLVAVEADVEVVGIDVVGLDVRDADGRLHARPHEFFGNVAQRRSDHRVGEVDDVVAVRVSHRARHPLPPVEGGATEARLERARVIAVRRESTHSASTWKARNSPSIISNTTTANGSPMITVACCSVEMPPIISMARVSRPVAAAQNIRTHLGPSDSLSVMCEVKCDMTRAPESALVT